MSLLRDLTSTIVLSEEQDLSKLPDDVMSEIQKHIREGAKDLTLYVANALELVHKAYELAGVQRPTPDMKAAWEQYEQNLQYAVNQLAKYRGLDGDWRMSASIFHEALAQSLYKKFKVELRDQSINRQAIIESPDIDTLVKQLTSRLPSEIKTSIVENSSSDFTSLNFSQWGIQHPLTVTIRQLS